MANWNELQFLRWSEFKHMAPSILQLEVTRLSRLLPTLQVKHPDVYNALVQVRYEITQFMKSLAEIERPPVSEPCIAHLRTAVLVLSFQQEQDDETIRRTLHYILDRLQYVFNRIGMVYV
jgi:hypothetical protein